MFPPVNNIIAGGCNKVDKGYRNYNCNVVICEVKVNVVHLYRENNTITNINKTGFPSPCVLHYSILLFLLILPWQWTFDSFSIAFSCLFIHVCMLTIILSPVSCRILISCCTNCTQWMKHQVGETNTLEEEQLYYLAAYFGLV